MSIKEQWIESLSQSIIRERLCSTPGCKNCTDTVYDLIEAAYENHLAQQPAVDRERLGMAVRDAYAKRCALKSPPRADIASTPWEAMSEFDRETDRCIADAVLASLAQQPADNSAQLRAAATEAVKRWEAWRAADGVFGPDYDPFQNAMRMLNGVLLTTATPPQPSSSGSKGTP